MPCYRPLDAWTHAPGGGKRVITFKDPRGHYGTKIKLPCQQCIGCRIDKSREWAARCMHEASLYHENSFVTLTYGATDEVSLNHADFQKFMKKLRKRTGRKIRYYMCGEYGQDQVDVEAGMNKPGLGRQHFHALIFNYDFPDRYFHAKTHSGDNIYRSAELEKCWTHGFSSTADLTFETAAYVARYVMKKVTGDRASEHYVKIDPYTMDEYPVQPEYTNMSLKPGIGQEWFEKYATDVFPSDEVLVSTKNGVKRIKTPAYYTKLLEKNNPKLHEEIKEIRVQNAKQHDTNNTYERLEVREEIARIKTSKLKRGLQ